MPKFINVLHFPVGSMCYKACVSIKLCCQVISKDYYFAPAPLSLSLYLFLFIFKHICICCKLRAKLHCFSSSS